MPGWKTNHLKMYLLFKMVILHCHPIQNGDFTFSCEFSGEVRGLFGYFFFHAPGMRISTTRVAVCGVAFEWHHPPRNCRQTTRRHHNGGREGILAWICLV